MTPISKTVLVLAATLAAACANPAPRKITNPGPYGNGYSNGFAIDGVPGPGGPGREAPPNDRDQDYQRRLEEEERERREQEQEQREQQQQQRDNAVPPGGVDRF